MIIPVILAGGSGTRLWPLSRSSFPKQLINLVDSKTMLQNTILRLEKAKNISEPIIICNDTQRFMVAEQLRTISHEKSKIILEPKGRNTAPAAAIACMKALEASADAVVMILPADHNITDEQALHAAMETALQLSNDDKLITFGIVPDMPETGYGYIKEGESLSITGKAYKIDKFVEKPNKETAEKYLNSGEYLWNSGMFMFKASKYLEELTNFNPEMVEKCKKAFKEGKSDLDFFRLDEKAFVSCPEDSIDYAVMEKTKTGVVIPLNAGWNDLGSWDALWHIGEKDTFHNVLKGDIIAHDVHSSYLHAESRMIAAVGLENIVVVETADAVLVAPRGKVQEVKKIVDKLKETTRYEASSHKKVFRPWGSYEGIDHEENFQVKRIVVKPGATLSLQKHFHRAEHWIVVRGTAIVTKGEEEFILKEDESTYIPLGIVHRLHNPGKIPLDLIEVQSGSYLGEDDIVRFEDIYGR